jgi:hypothetical protein
MTNRQDKNTAFVKVVKDHISASPETDRELTVFRREATQATADSWIFVENPDGLQNGSNRAKGGTRAFVRQEIV